MRAVTAVCFLLAIFALGEAHWYPQQTITAGDSCTPRYGAARCGDPIVMSKVSSPASGVSYGPNVCHFEKMVRSKTLTYEWQQFCNHWGCSWHCVCTNECNGTEVNVTYRYADCCEGYTTRSSSPDFDFWLSHHFHKKRVLISQGCPIRLMDSVLDCLSFLNLTEFYRVVDEAFLKDTLSNTNTSFTIFAPTNEAAQSIVSVLPQDIFRNIATSHIVEETIPDRKLFHGAVFKPLMNETLLHVTDVAEYQGWGYYQWKASERTFINGAEVIEKDACQAVNGIVHIVNQVLPTSTQSISEILEGDEEYYGTFKDLLDAANFSIYLDRSNPRTIFVPSNAAFDELGFGVSDCLKEEENLRTLKYILLIHITSPVEYTSSLSLRNHIQTFSRFYLMVQEAIVNNTVLITRNEIPLARPDTPARNGVIHGIDEVIIPPCVNLTAICTLEPPPLTLPPVVIDEENPETDEMGPGVVGGAEDV